MSSDQLLLPGQVVKKSNQLARARWHPKSVWEARIVALLASKVTTDDADFHTYQIPVSELAGVTDENLSGEQYRQIKEALLRLPKATIELQGDGRNFCAYSLFAKCGYKDGSLLAGFHPDLKPHFLALKSHFTSYSLFEFLRLPSVYSQRLFEILRSWCSEAEVILTVADLHDRLGTPESFRQNFAQFRRWVLEKAHRDISSKTELKYEWQPVRKGRTVDAIRFIFPTSPKALAEAQRARAAEREKKKAAADERTRTNDNRLFIAAVNCFKAKGKQCRTQDHRQAKVCHICARLVLPETKN